MSIRLPASPMHQAVSQGAGETGAASSQMLSSARSLSREGNHLKIEVDKFVHSARAA